MLRGCRIAAGPPAGGENIGKNRNNIRKSQRVLEERMQPLSFSEIMDGLAGYRQPTTNQLAALLGQQGRIFRMIATVPVRSSLAGTHREGLYCLAGHEERLLGSLPFDARIVTKEVKI